jgi:hypothetical protein
MEKHSINHNTANDGDMPLSVGVNKFTVKVKRNYYGEIQEEERVIEGENYKRAKFEFNNRHIDWYVVDTCI